MRIVVVGLTVTSSWGNGHATTYRGLLRELAAGGHDVLFLEHDKPWYADHRDLPPADAPGYRVTLYDAFETLCSRHAGNVAAADAVVVGSYVPQGIDVGRWAVRTARGPVAFYDIDTPVTLAALSRGDCAYLDAALVNAYDLYLSFAGGPTLTRLAEMGSPAARPLYCNVDPRVYVPDPSADKRYDLTYLGTYSPDRQGALGRLLVEPARRRPDLRFAVAGPQYPASIDWPSNVERIEHLPPSRHRAFYNAGRWTLNVTRGDMVAAGWSPSVRLFEAGACGVPVVSDRWPGFDDFFPSAGPARAAVVADTPNDVLAAMKMPSSEAAAVGARARRIVLERHTAKVRAGELVEHLRAAATVTRP